VIPWVECGKAEVVHAVDQRAKQEDIGPY
jgi:hypothetical protein